jgi:hypothetical protein
VDAGFAIYRDPDQVPAVEQIDARSRKPGELEEPDAQKPLLLEAHQVEAKVKEKVDRSSVRGVGVRRTSSSDHPVARV